MFSGCKDLTDIEIPNSVTSIGSNAFFACYSLTSIKIPNSVISIRGYAFESCISLTSINIPEGVTCIESYTFSRCSELTNISIPEGVTSIGVGVFSECSSLISINVNQNNEYYCSENGILFDKNKTKIIAYPAGKNDLNYSIPNSVTTIYAYAFSGCSKLTSIEISNSVTSIGAYAFNKNIRLANIEIPNSVTKIYPYAFIHCSNLTNINIPEGVMSIGEKAFYVCSSLSSVEISSNTITMGEEVFAYCKNLARINILDSVTSIETDEKTFDGCNATKYYKSSPAAIELAKADNTFVLDDASPEVELESKNINEGIEVTVTSAEDEGAGLAQKAYSFDGGKTWQAEPTMAFAKNDRIIVKVRDALGNETSQIIKTDFISPIINSVEAKEDNADKKITVKVTAKDAEETDESLSTGVAGYAYSKDGGTTWTEWKNEAEYTFDGLEYDTEYTIIVKVKDGAGNETTSEEKKVKTIKKTEPEEKVKLGDVTDDGDINARDKLAFARHIVVSIDPIIKARHEDWELTGKNLEAADVDQNGVVNAVDKLRIARYIAVDTDDVFAKRHPKWKLFQDD